MDEWPLRTIGDLVTLQRGIDLPSQDRNDGRVPIMGSFGVTGFHDEAACRGPGVTVGRSGASIGTVSYIEGDYWPLNTCLYVRNFHGNNSRFAFYFLQTIDLAGMNSGSAQPSLNRNFVHPFPVRFPGRSEQDEIAELLSALDDKIELNRRMNETLEAQARALFRDWFVDFGPVKAKMAGDTPYLAPDLWSLFPHCFDDGVPKGWRYANMKQLCATVTNGGTPKRDQPNFWEPKEIPWLTSGEVRRSFITNTDQAISAAGLSESSAKWVEPYSTVVALYGATAGEVAFTGIKLTTNQAVCALKPLPSYTTFNYLALSDAKNKLAGLARGSAQQNLSKGIVENFEAVVPPEETLMEHFFEITAPNFQKILANELESGTLAQTRDLLLPKLMSGEIRVGDMASKELSAA